MTTHTTPLPPADHYEYFSRLWHGGDLVPWREFRPRPGWQWPIADRDRMLRLFEGADEYVVGRDCVDLGCHTGFIGYIARHRGARSVVAANCRPRPMEVGRFALAQLGVSGVEFQQLDLEDTARVEAVCRGRDTVILCQVLQHTRNPVAVLEAIGRSGAKHLLFNSSLAPDTGLAQLTYTVQSTQGAYQAWSGEKSHALAARPNLLWIETVLYSLGWRVERHRVDPVVQLEWFAAPGLDQFPPRTGRAVTLAATRFDSPAVRSQPVDPADWWQ